MSSSRLGRCRCCRPRLAGMTAVQAGRRPGSSEQRGCPGGRPYDNSPWRRIQLLHALRDRICSSVASSGVPRGTPSPQSKWPQPGSCRSLGSAPVRIPSRCTGYTTYLISGYPAAPVTVKPYRLRSARNPPVPARARHGFPRTERGRHTGSAARLNTSAGDSPIRSPAGHAVDRTVPCLFLPRSAWCSGSSAGSVRGRCDGAQQRVQLAVGADVLAVEGSAGRGRQSQREVA